MVLANDNIGQETMMEVAERYLEELAKRCMVQVELHEEGLPSITRFKSCRLHDLMRDLCLGKAKEENMYKVIDLGHENIGIPLANSSPVIERHYRFVIRNLPEDYIIPAKEQRKHLRSLMCEGPLGRKIISRVNNFKMLRVLAFEDCDLAHQPWRRYFNSPLECIGHLVHLRYLSLRNSKIFELPSSLGNLNYLETLDLSGIDCSKISNELWKLGHLRHLYLPNSSRKLRLDKLSKQLEILELVDNVNCDFKDLSKLTNLRALKVTVYNNLEDLEQIIHHISSLNYIRFTSLAISGCDFGIDNNKGSVILEQALFCKNLHQLYIEDTLCKRLPDYQPHLFPLSSLTELTLLSSKIEEDPMSTLEKFPNLWKLILFPNSFVGKEMICHAMGFSQLKVLWLVGLENLEKWKVEEGAMPKLSSLVIWNCKKLEMIPDGLRYITTLSEITLDGMPENFRNRVQIINDIEGPDFDKTRHVPSVNVY